jgi:dephospho-CoA kinase
MVILGLTGSIGMGKSAAATMLRRLGIPVHDADAVVHRLLGKGGAAVPLVARAFPQAVADGVVDRPTLGRLVFGNSPALKRLEAIVHPLVRQSTVRFLAAAARARRRLVVLDVPLLLESGGGRYCDAVAVVSAPGFLQAQRVLRRPGMTPARYAAILARQMPDREKRRRADIVVTTGLGKGRTYRQLARAVRAARRRRGRAWSPRSGMSRVQDR